MSSKDVLLSALSDKPYDGPGLVDGLTEHKSALLEALRGPAPPPPPPETEFWGPLGKSVLWEGGPGLIGIKPPDDVEEFQQRHPILGLGAALVGMAAPYGLAAKFGPMVAARTPGLAQALEFAASPETKPIVSGAVKAVAEFAPFYMARLAGAAAFGDKGAIGDVAKDAAVETALIGAMGGVGKAIALGRPFTGVQRAQEGRIANRYEDYLVNESPQHRVGTINQILRNNPGLETQDEAIFQDLINVRNDLYKGIVSEDPAARIAFVQKLDSGQAAKINPLFSNPKIKGVEVSKLPDPVELRGDYEVAIRDLAPGSPPGDFEANVKFPRILKAETPEASEKLWKKIQGSFQHQVEFGKQAWLSKEADGVYVMAKQLKGFQGPPWEPTEWAIFKTTKPELFAPRAARFGELPTKGSFWTTEVAKLDENLRGIEDARFIQTLLKETENPDLRLKMPAAAGVLSKALGPEAQKFLKESKKGLEFTKEELKTLLAPSLFQGSRDPEFNALMNISRMAHMRGLARAGQLFYGNELPKEGKSLFQEILGANERVGGIEKLIDALDETDLKVFERVHINGASIAQARADYGASERLVALLRKLQNVDRGYMNQMEKLQATTGHALITPIENHYMMTRSWFGDWRVPVFKKNVEGAFEAQPVGIASGFSKKDALDEASALSTELGKLYGDKFGFSENMVQLVGRESDLSMAQSVNLTRKEARSFLRARDELLTKATKEPLRGKTRREFLGFKRDLEKRHVKEIIHGNLIENERIIQSNLLSHLLQPRVDKLARRDPGLGQQLGERIRLMAGEKSGWLSSVDKALDPWLAPVAGKNAASNIVRAFNKSLFSLTLGFGDLGFVGINALTPIITVMPEVAYTLTAPPERLAKYYTHSLVWDRGPVNMRHLDPLRVVMSGLRAMGKPSAEEKEAFTWAMDHGVISPKYAEEFLGEQAITIKNWRKMLTGDAGVLEWLKSVNNFLPAKSEEFTRGVSFMSGLKVGKDFFKLEGPELWRFAAELTARTNFLYSSADRAKIITGTIGSLFGLFKNWGMHQVGNTMLYAGEAAARRNFVPLLWSMGAIGALGGAGAMPFYGVADSFSKLATDKTLTENIYNGMWGDKASDVFVYGFPALLGTALQGRVAPTGNQIARDVSFLFQSATLDRMAALSDAIGSSVKEWQDTGVHPLALQRNRNLFYRALLPRSLYRALSFTEEGALQSLRNGNALTGPSPISKRVQYVLGLTPLEFEKALDLSEELWADQGKQKEAISSLGRAWAEAAQRGNRDEMAFLARRMIYDGVNWDSVMRSADSFTRGTKEEQLQRDFDLYVTTQKRKARGL